MIDQIATKIDENLFAEESQQTLESGIKWGIC